METAEHASFTQLIRVLCRWLAFEIDEHRAGRAAEVATHINRIVDFTAMDLTSAYRASRAYVEPAPTRVDALEADYRLSLRGKTLIQAIVHYLSGSGREVKYSKVAIIDMCLRLFQPNPHIDRILTEARTQLA